MSRGTRGALQVFQEFKNLLGNRKHWNWGQSSKTTVLTVHWQQFQMQSVIHPLNRVKWAVTHSTTPTILFNVWYSSIGMVQEGLALDSFPLAQSKVMTAAGLRPFMFSEWTEMFLTKNSSSLTELSCSAMLSKAETTMSRLLCQSSHQCQQKGFWDSLCGDWAWSRRPGKHAVHDCLTTKNTNVDIVSPAG